VRLYFTDKTPTAAAVLTGLPPLPIVVDYLNLDVDWPASAEARLASALRYPDRVCGIAVAATFENVNAIFKALETCFPILESLEVKNIDLWGYNLTPMFPTTSTKSLRRLKISSSLQTLAPVLSATTALVDLTLTTSGTVSPRLIMSLLLLLQCLPYLRHLDICFGSSIILAAEVPHMKMSDIIPLAELTHFRCMGDSSPVEDIMTRMAAPSLQKLHLFFIHDIGYEFRIPHTTKFIRNARKIFLGAQLTFSRADCNLSLLADPHSVDDPPFSVTVCGPTSHIFYALSALLATVEDVTIAFSSLSAAARAGRSQWELALCRRLFEKLPNGKILRVQHAMETEVANVFRHVGQRTTTGLLLHVPKEKEADTDATVPSGFAVDSLGFLPSLERIEVFVRSPDLPVPESERAAALEPFEALAATRRQAGLPVKVYWNTDQVLPASFDDGDGDDDDDDEEEEEDDDDESS
jgi:hypothetical protein